MSSENAKRNMDKLITKVQIFLMIEQYGPHNEDEIHKQSLDSNTLFRWVLFCTVYALSLALVFLLILSSKEISSMYFSSQVTEIIAKIDALLVVILFLYSARGGGKFQAEFLFREMGLLTLYRKLSFVESYNLYIALGLVISGAVVILLNIRSSVLISDIGSYALFFGLMNLLTSYSCILRTYLLESKNKAIVLDWITKWKKQYGHEPG